MLINAQGQGDVERFVQLCPEFEGAKVDLLRRTLEQTAKRIDPNVWGVLQDEGHKLLTAHILSLSPFGKNAKMKNEDGRSVYEFQYKELRKQVWAKARPLI